ncbi:conserved hypothetical protein [Desulfarculus baarsii DSM 2075]|uniref:PhiE125 gp8 family phage protein n=1 Tax=Desulfarculus baarsii (strain ATCC 33931 / DSM 2075 / LMG 7858 / VKM B-1802 / 2st14) TaxID=644282 RepID=E1QK43_DESB2|nr:conserved hypothetical protein [Desulfarculus baarsii DSM 2075]
MPVKVIIPPALEPVSLAEAKLHARVDNDLEDDLIASFIEAARRHGESLTHRAFAPQTLELTLDAFPPRGGRLDLPRPPLAQVLWVKYNGPDGVEQTMDPVAYRVMDASDELPAFIIPEASGGWPETMDRPGAVRIRYTAGWPLDDDGQPTIPEAIRTWLLVRVTGLYEQRENYSARQASAMPRDFVDCLLDPFRVPEVA